MTKQKLCKKCGYIIADAIDAISGKDSPMCMVCGVQAPLDRMIARGAKPELIQKQRKAVARWKREQQPNK